MPDAPHVTLAVKPNPAVRFRILHEDPDILVIDKPAGLVTQPGKGHASDSLLNGIFALREGEMGKFLHNLGPRRDYGILHRLDKETSGLLIVAKTPNAYDQLRRDFEARNVDKEYLALTAGIPSPMQGVVQARLKEVEVPNPDPRAWKGASIKKVVISRQGQEAISAYKVLAHTQNRTRSVSAGHEIRPQAIENPKYKIQNTIAPAALIRVTIKTGRLHQIRAHMTFLHCQVLGDDLYKTQDSGLRIQDYPRPPRLCLHAAHLGFKHPATNKWTHYHSPLPPDLAKYALKLGLILPP